MFSVNPYNRCHFRYLYKCYSTQTIQKYIFSARATKAIQMNYLFLFKHQTQEHVKLIITSIPMTRNDKWSKLRIVSWLDSRIWLGIVESCRKEDKLESEFRAWMKKLNTTNVITIYMIFAMSATLLSRRHLSYLVSLLFSLSVSMPCSSIFSSFTEEVK